MTEWISIKDKLPSCDGDMRIPYVLAFHSIHGVGVAWFWKLNEDRNGDIYEEGIVQEMEDKLQDKYLCSFHFIKNRVDWNYQVDCVDECFGENEIFERSPHFHNLGTITHWRPLPNPPEES